jgi:alpha-tubulin suppressor-like RCC1 family protein
VPTVVPVVRFAPVRVGRRRLVARVAALALLGAVVAASSAAAVTPAPVAAVVAPPVGVSKYVPVSPARILDTRTGVGAPAARPASGASVQVQVTGRGGVPSTGVTAVTLNVVVTEPREVGYVQALPAGSGTLGASSNINIYYLGQTAGNLITVPVGANGAVTLYDVAGGNLIADVSGYFTAATASTDGRYVALNPTRVLDSRTGTGLPPVLGISQKPAAGQAFTVRGTGAGGVPAVGVSSVAMTVTATESTAPGFVQVVPTGGTTALGETSNVNLTGSGQTVANLVIVPVGAGGTFQLYSSSGTHLLVDVVGYFTDTTAAQADTGLFVPLDPARLLDTRATSAPAGRSLTALAPLGRAGIPADGVSAVFLNPTVTDTTGPGFLQLYPAGRGTPGTSSSLNFTGAGQTIATATIAALGDRGVSTIFTSTRTQVLVDSFGYFTGPPTPPARFTAYGWGWNAAGGLGDGTTTDQFAPAQVGADNRWASIAAGATHTAAVKTDGTLWAWGNNFNGELGDGTGTDRSVPGQVGTDAHWASIAVGSNHTLAVKTDGTLWAWGSNTFGQLGDGSTTDRSVPVQVGTESRWASVAAGNDHSVGIKTDGSLWSWGYAEFGDLGTGTPSTTAVQSTPVQVGTDLNWVSAASGGFHTVAIKTDRTLWAWGYNGTGQLGDGTTIDRLAPVQVGAGTPWASVAASGNHTVAVGTDGSLWGWGDNSTGQVGDGTTTNRSAPVRVGTDTRWASAAAGWGHTAAVKTDGTLWTWGWNVSGQLGDGTATDRSTPGQLGTDTGWASVSAGYLDTVALRS